jgi:methylated-DNA-protein-cysteine methyltransferase-like protein
MRTNYQKIYDAVKRIPSGKVATYGQIAKLAGLAGQARMVGYALYSLPKGLDIPWHRVINAKGKISQLPDPEWRTKQRFLLETEGVTFDSSDQISLTRFQWSPDSFDRQGVEL